MSKKRLAEVLLAAVEEIPRGKIETPSLTASDKVHDLKTVVGFDLRFLPARPRENIQIAFDSHAAVRHAKVFEQRDDVEPVRNLAALAVDGDRHSEVTSRASALRNESRPCRHQLGR